jgi:MFS family permease
MACQQDRSGRAAGQGHLRSFAGGDEERFRPCRSLEEALSCLEDDHAFLLKGDVFTEELIETFINYKRRMKPTPSACARILTNSRFITTFTAVWPIYAVLLFNGSVRSFNGAAGQAFLPSLIPAEHFPNAVTWGSSIFQGAMVLGPALGGAIYGFAASPVPVYCASAAACLGALTLLGFIRIQPSRSTAAKRSVPEVLEGIRFIWRNKPVLGSISLDLFAVLLGGAVALLPVYAREVLKTGAYGLGILRGAPSAGAVLMAVALAYWPLRRRAGIAMFACVFGFGAFTIVFGLSRSLPLSIISLVLVGASDMVSVIVRHTLVQLGTPDEMRGRVSAVNMLFIGASNEIGQFESGITAQWFGAAPAVVLGGAGTIVIVLLWAWLFPALRRVDKL